MFLEYEKQNDVRGWKQVDLINRPNYEWEIIFQYIFMIMKTSLFYQKNKGHKIMFLLIS